MTFPPHPAESTEVHRQDLRDFLVAMAHDLREPLRTISCFAELLVLQRGSLNSSDTCRLLTSISDGANRIRCLFDDALAFATEGASRGERFDVEAENVLRFALADLEPAIGRAKAAITNDPLPRVNANYGTLAQVFENLVGNAVKYHGEERPRIHIGCTRRGADWMFSVADNGIGIDPEYQNDVFLPLKRLHTQKQYPGTGLGLSICKRIVESHGGRIWLESRPGAGSTFYFTIPDTKQAATALMEIKK